jgi:cytochrome P450/NADPH-cytochrome P450 reductase
MLTGVDRETGERLDDVNIRYQIIAFLIAGHKTTSGLRHNAPDHVRVPPNA